MSVRATARPVSGLFAAPATTRQSIERASASSISPPAAQGASTSSSLARIASADGATSMPCAWAMRVQQPGSRSQPTTSAPASTSFAASEEPTLPRPTTPTRLPSKSCDPVAAASPRPIAWKTVSAVMGEGSPPPPLDTDWPTTKRVIPAMWSMSVVEVPMSSAVM